MEGTWKGMTMGSLGGGRVPQNRKLSQQQEKRVAKLVGGSLQPGSGSGWKRQNDVRSDGVLWEMKRTSKKSITIKASDLEHLRKNALLEDRVPVMHIELGDRRWVVIPEDDYLEMIERWSM